MRRTSVADYCATAIFSQRHHYVEFCHARAENKKARRQLKFLIGAWKILCLAGADADKYTSAYMHVADTQTEMVKCCQLAFKGNSGVLLTKTKHEHDIWNGNLNWNAAGHNFDFHSKYEFWSLRSCHDVRSLWNLTKFPPGQWKGLQQLAGTASGCWVWNGRT